MSTKDTYFFKAVLLNQDSQTELHPSETKHTFCQVVHDVRTPPKRLHARGN